MSVPSPITGTAAICALGHGPRTILDKIRAEQTGLTFNHRYKVQINAPLGEIANALIPNGPGTDIETLQFELLAALIGEIDEKTKVFSRYQAHEIGLFLGTTTYGVGKFLGRVDAQTNAQDFYEGLNAQSQPSALLGRLCEKFPIAGFNICFSNSCASSAVAIGEAHRALNSGMLKAVFAGGADILNLATVSGFDALQVLNHERSFPLTEKTAGINLGEGAGLFLLESAPSAKPLAWVKGYGACNEAFHPTRPDPQARGMLKAMRAALKEGGRAVEDVAYVNAHGTGTAANDAAELLALRTLFGDRKMYESTKAWHGHTLAASGVLEGAICIETLNRTSGAGPACALNNSFGFGGTFVSLLFDRVGAHA